jgi:hypothetical protein
VIKKYDNIDENYFYLRISDEHVDSYLMRVPGSEEVASYYKPRDSYQMHNIKLCSGREL